LSQRGYDVTTDVKADWAASLFINQTDGMEQALGQKRTVGYRVAGGYLPEWFRVMGLAIKSEHHRANAASAYALEAADCVIYQSQWAKQQLDALLYERTDRFAVIYNGIEVNHFTPALKRPAGPPILGSVGVLRYRYRLETLCAMSRRLGMPHQLLIVGSLDAECREVLRRYQADPVVGPRIIHQPYTPPQQLPALYQQMSVLVHPVCGDVCPNVVAEALACGTPVVTPRFGGTAELVGEGGIIFDCAPWVYDEHFVDIMMDAVAQALTHTEILSRRARQRAEEALNAQTMTDKYLAVLGLPLHNVSRPSQTSIFYWRRRLSQKGAQWIARPRFYAALGLRKLRQAHRRRSPTPPNPRPRIAFTLFDFHLGGIENWLYRLARQLHGEFEFHFLATTVTDFLPKFREIGPCAHAPGVAQMIAYLQKHNIDIVQVHNQRWPVDAALAAGVPHILERTDGTRSCTRIPKYGLSLVIASSQGTTPLIARHIASEHIRLVYNGIDLEEVDSAPIQRAFPPETFVLGRASRFGRGKNLGLLIAAMQRLHQRHPRLRLVLVGGDSLMPGAEPIGNELRRQAAALGERVMFANIQENALPWIKGFDVGTCVSNPDNEGVPNSLMETMACGKPVIATHVDQVAELVEDNVNGLLIPPGDVESLCAAIERLAADPSLRRRLGEAGRRTIAERFSLARAAAQYADIYRRLLGH
jgi:glycosyltransferase involved in cell wall biosynthesis